MSSSAKPDFQLFFNSPDTNQKMSSEELNGLILSGLIPADFIYTLIRYSKLPVDLFNSQGGDSTSNGPIIDYSAEHHWVAGVITFVVFCATVGNMIVTHKTTQRGKEVSSYKKLYGIAFPSDIASKKVDVDGAGTPDASYAKQLDPIRTLLNESLKNDNKLLKKNAKLKKRYERIEITAEESKDKKLIGLNVTMIRKKKEKENKEHKDYVHAWWMFWRTERKPAPMFIRKGINFVKKATKKIKKVGNTLIDSMGLASYAYWVFFIGAAIFTGIFGTGIGGVNDWLAFLVPTTCGAAYAGLKGINLWRNRNLKRKKRDDLNNIMDEALLNKEMEDAGLSVNTPTESPTVVTKASIFNDAIVAGIGTYMGWQFNLWLAGDILNKAVHVILDTGLTANMLGATIFGLGLFSLARVIVKGVMDGYREFKKNPANLNKGFWQYVKFSVKQGWKHAKEMVYDYCTRPRNSRWEYFSLNSTLELKEKAARVDSLQNDVDDALQRARDDYKDPNKIAPAHLARLEQLRKAESRTSDKWQNFRNLTHVAGFAMSGVYLVRTVFVKGATAYLLPGLGAAICLSNPVTIGLMVGIGLAWGLYRYYHYRKKRNEDKIHKLNQRIQLLKETQAILENAEHKAVSASRLNAAPPPGPVAVASAIAMAVLPSAPTGSVSGAATLDLPLPSERASLLAPDSSRSDSPAPVPTPVVAPVVSEAKETNETASATITPENLLPVARAVYRAAKATQYLAKVSEQTGIAAIDLLNPSGVAQLGMFNQRQAMAQRTTSCAAEMKQEQDASFGVENAVSVAC